MKNSKNRLRDVSKMLMNTVFVGATGIVSAFIIHNTNTPSLVTAPPPVDTPEVELKVPSWKCPDCTTEEQYVLSTLQERTQITDKNALATLMGNIKQESKFIPNICEGGARVSYTECKVGGYGLIQWTSIGRYKGLGNFCARFSCDPSSLEGQTRWMINEPIFQRVLPIFEGHDQSISYYMRPAYRWLGWGIKGNREVYAFEYLDRLVLS